MSSNRNRPPKAPEYLPSKGNPGARAYTYVYQDGKRKQVTLPGGWGSPESWREFHRVAGLFLEGLPVRPLEKRSSSSRPTTGTTVAELAARFLVHARTYYRKNGKPTAEVGNFKTGIKRLLKLYRDYQTADFDSVCLEQVRDLMIRDGLARNTINVSVRRLRHVFRWGAKKKLVPAVTLADLQVLDGLKAGRSRAKETEKRRPVPEKDMRKTLLELAPQLAAMVELQWEAGMRSQDVTSMCPQDIDRSGDPWLYWPKDHKTKHRTKAEDEMPVILFEREQQILRPFLDRVPRPDPGKPVFSPKDAEAWRASEDRKARTSDPSANQSRDEARRRNPKRDDRDGYDTHSYGRAVIRACQRAGVRWTPHQLRHACASNGIARGISPHAMQVRLRHRDLRSTLGYQTPDVSQAIEELRRKA